VLTGQSRTVGCGVLAQDVPKNGHRRPPPDQPGADADPSNGSRHLAHHLPRLTARRPAQPQWHLRPVHPGWPWTRVIPAVLASVQVWRDSTSDVDPFLATWRLTVSTRARGARIHSAPSAGPDMPHRASNRTMARSSPWVDPAPASSFSMRLRRPIQIDLARYAATGGQLTKRSSGCLR